MIKKIPVFVLLVLSALPATASDAKREQDYAAYIRQNPTVGKAVWLQADGRSFLGLFTEAEKADNANAAIILHDLGEYPDQKPLIHALRTVLPQHNWTTLALQMPLREQGASEADYYPLFAEVSTRLEAAIDHLQKNGAKNIVIIGYGLGALMAAYVISEKPDNIQALAAISLAVPETTAAQAQTQAFIKSIALPLLDIYAEFDLSEVADTARLRRMAGKENPVYLQVQMNGENHAYQQDHERLVKRVYSWLSSTLRQE
ncbi:MAG: alpha/beta hydrolase family protein [Methylococcaceae bacterium]|nr:alpha/beta hydrolase family protein [Methylococcaceae bacterium]